VYQAILALLFLRLQPWVYWEKKKKEKKKKKKKLKMCIADYQFNMYVMYFKFVVSSKHVQFSSLFSFLKDEFLVCVLDEKFVYVLHSTYFWVTVLNGYLHKAKFSGLLMFCYEKFLL
jgi:hypothetical protein